MDRDYQALQRNYLSIKAEIEPRQLVDFLFEKKFLTKDEKELILGKPTREERAEALLQKVFHCGPEKGFSIFLTALALEGYHHLVDRLNSPENNLD